MVKRRPVIECYLPSLSQIGHKPRRAGIKFSRARPNINHWIETIMHPLATQILLVQTHSTFPSQSPDNIPITAKIDPPDNARWPPALVVFRGRVVAFFSDRQRELQFYFVVFSSSFSLSLVDYKTRRSMCSPLQWACNKTQLYP